jgi:hypothetical protein
MNILVCQPLFRRNVGRLEETFPDHTFIYDAAPR